MYNLLARFGNNLFQKRWKYGFHQTIIILSSTVFAPGTGGFCVDAAGYGGKSCCSTDDPFIEALPKGYETELGERGVTLSQGQRQLLCIARAILANPRLLILDEATSNIDTRTERLVQEAIDTLLEGRTAFVIAHRLSTIRNADRIVVIDRGQVVESETHSDLLNSGGVYANL